MSKGPGRVQRVIREMIAAEPEGAWTTDDICRRVYPEVGVVSKKHRVAVLRALRRVKFPSNDLRFESVGQGGEYCLFDCCNDESRIRLEYIKHLADCRLRGWKVDSLSQWKESGHYKHRIAEATRRAASNREYRDAGTVEQLEIDIRNAKMLRAMRFSHPNIDALEAQLAALKPADVAIVAENHSGTSAGSKHPPARNYNPIIDGWEGADAESRNEFLAYLQRRREPVG